MVCDAAAGEMDTPLCSLVIVVVVGVGSCGLNKVLESMNVDGSAVELLQWRRNPGWGTADPSTFMLLNSCLFTHCLPLSSPQPLTPPTTTRQHRALCQRGVIADAVQVCPSPLQASQTTPRHKVEFQNVHKRSLSASHHWMAVSAHRVCISVSL